jgi:hypothetical protein
MWDVGLWTARFGEGRGIIGGTERRGQAGVEGRWARGEMVRQEASDGRRRATEKKNVTLSPILVLEIEIEIEKHGFFQ